MEAITPDSLDIILANERDRRTFAYLVDTCGLQRVIKARQALPGRTRPYVSNIAKSLGVTIPEGVVITPREEGRRHLSEIKDFLAARIVAAPATQVRRN
ncbi:MULTISPECIES: hypothetical protein [Paraburkholderia]|uniref:Cryptic plasmid protein A n=1 Tax=Paraburkholderia dioscoreae TaxID=2604047 RepID=A0A5Q4YUQ7_9BURK|nr:MULTISPECIES: hypothetical protein [Paraburkholderia]MDR8397139.1 hypothetical protein [Paraburkholderia sp. USG1]VVD27470.1 conserved protein of unknown function [Paraburkholderia dioscoreae]